MKAWQIAGLTCALAAGLLSCAHSGDSQVLQYRGAVEPLRTGNTCQASDVTRLLPEGTLDLAMAKSYRFFPALVSLMPALNGISGSNPNLLDANTITLNSMQVTVVSGMLAKTPFAQPSQAPNKSTNAAQSWTVPMTGTIPSNSQLIAAADLVPEKVLVGGKFIPIGEDWRSRFFTAASAKDFSKIDLVLSFQFVGTTLTGDNVISDPMTLPLHVCYGCLLTPATVSSDPTAYFAGCSTGVLPDAFIPPCVPGQEDQVDCRYYCHECQRGAVLEKSLSYEGCNTTLCPP